MVLLFELDRHRRSSRSDDWLPAGRYMLYGILTRIMATALKQSFFGNNRIRLPRFTASPVASGTGSLFQGGQMELMRSFRPSVAAAALRNDGTE
jgi:hypothetical protein